MANRDSYLTLVGLWAPLAISPVLLVVHWRSGILEMSKTIVALEHGSGSLLVPCAILLFIIVSKSDVMDRPVKAAVLTLLAMCLLGIRGAVVNEQLHGIQTPLSWLPMLAIVIGYGWLAHRNSKLVLEEREEERRRLAEQERERRQVVVVIAPEGGWGELGS